MVEEEEGDDVTARIYTGAEARALRETATPGPYRVYSNAVDDNDTGDEWTVSRGDEVFIARVSADDRDDGSGAEEIASSCEADADLIAAAPDLAASVEHWHARAERAEDALRAEVANASAVHKDSRAVMAKGVERVEVMRAELNALRVIIEGRTTPPTDAEIDAHGGLWLVIFHGTASLADASRVLDRDGARVVARNARLGAHGVVTSTWRALDSQRRLCAKPVVTEAP